MRRTNEIPTRANKFAAISAAHEFIFKNARRISYPLNPADLFTDNYNILPWTEACAQSGSPDFFGLKKRGSDARTIKFQDTDSTLTVYDDTVLSRQRVRFTIAHELGHLVLMHLDKYLRTSPLTAGLEQNEYKVLENEADFFAAETLAPLPLIILLGMEDPREIRSFFNLSAAASVNRVKDLAWRGDDRLYLSKLERFEEIFGGLINFYKNALRCDNCHSVHMGRKACPLCGGKSGVLFRQLFKTGGSYMRYELFKPKRCAVCDNSEISPDDNFCKICGTALTNSCPACDITLDSNSRYCPKCGGHSEFYLKNYLTDWAPEKRSIEKRSIANFEFSDEFIL